MVPQVAHQGAAVYAFYADDAVLLHIIRQRPGRAPVAGNGRVFLYDETLDVRLAGFHILGIDADVADLRIGHRDHLPLVRRVGEDLLVAGHARIEDHLAGRLSLGAEGSTRVNLPVG